MKKSAAAGRFFTGFTLIELLVVMVVFSLLALMSYRGLSAVLDTRRHVKQETDKWHRATAFFSRFAQDLALVEPRRGRNSSEAQAAFIASPGRSVGAYVTPYLEFSRFSSVDGNDAGQRVAYVLNDRKEIELWLWPGMDNPSGTLPERHAVLAGVAAMEMQYLDGNLALVSTWPPPGDLAALPKAVQIHIVLVSGEAVTRIFAL